MKIITSEPREALTYEKIPENCVFTHTGPKLVWYLKLCDGKGAVSLGTAVLHPNEDFTISGDKFYLVDAELVIK